MSGLFVPRFKREQQQQQQQQQQQNDNHENNDNNNNTNTQQQQLLLTTSLQDQWKLMHRAINGSVNRVTVENIELIVDDIFTANIRRGRGVFCSVITNAQLVSPHLTDVFSALVARLNSRVPELGELLLRRLLLQLWQHLRQRNNEQVKSTCIFLSHLAMAQVCTVVVVLKLLALFLCSSGVSAQRILVAAAIFTETYDFLERDYPEAFAAVLEPARQLVESGELDARSEEALDGVLKLVRQHQLKKEQESRGGKNNIQGQFQQKNAAAATSTKAKQQLEEEKSNKKKVEILKAIIDEAISFGQCHDEVDVDLTKPPAPANPELDKFPNLQKLQKTAQELSDEWKLEDEEYFSSPEIQQVRLSEERRKELEERITAVAQTQIPRGRVEGEEEAKKNLAASLVVVTASDFQGLADVETANARKEIFLAFQSSMRSEEIVHKLLGTVSAIASKGGVGNTQKAIQRQQQLIVSVVIQLAIKEKSFDALYANVADLLCRSSSSAQQSYRINFEEAFRIAYRAADQYVRRELNILASIYASLFHRGSIDWCCFDVVDLRSPTTIASASASHNENSSNDFSEEKSKSQRIFLEDLLKELSAAMSLSKLVDRFHFDESVVPHVKKMFPRDGKTKKEDSQWATAFYISIGMRSLASVLEE